MTKKRERSLTKSSKSEGEESAAPAKADPKTSQEESSSDNKKRGWDAIESLFDDKKKDKKDRHVEQQEQKKLNDEYRRQQKAERASSGSASASGTTNFSAKEKWADDGLGGKYNTEGFTGRVQEGVKVFKAHLLSKPGAGSSDQCPFDCECCYI
jgi:beta-xylosidase